MVRNRVRQEVVEQSVQLQLGFPALLVGGVNSLGDTHGPATFLHNLLLDQLEPHVGMAKEAGEFEDE